ncbi:MAG: class II aldolase and adducin N-terminal domain-containing protein [Paracoccaceae bacterium]|nr:class II aldolase and adducin N-terminal domain-containing protein [Paracoccaceae bacterium]
MSVSALPVRNNDNWQKRVDLAAAFQWTARLNMHEAVANHFSLVLDDKNERFLINPNQRHFSRIKASDLLELDIADKSVLTKPDAPDATAWGLHSSIHKYCRHAVCALHVHSIYATVLASLSDSRLLPVDQNSAMFFNRVAIDEDYGGLAFESEGKRCAQLMNDPKIKVLIMGNHGILVIGSSVADAFDRLYYFERACQTYILALQTGKTLRLIPDGIAEKVARQIEGFSGEDSNHFKEIKLILDQEGSDYAS